MHDWFAPTTEYARVKAEERYAASQKNHGDPIMFERTPSEETPMQTIVLKKFDEFGEATRNGDTSKLRPLINFLYPIWRDNLVHTNEQNRHQRSMFTDWLGRPVNYSHVNYVAAGNFFHELFEAAYQHTEEEVEVFVQRSEALIEALQYLPFIHKEYLEGAFSVDDVRALYTKSTNIFRSSNVHEVVAGLRAGFTVEELKKIKPIFFLNENKYTPKQLRFLLQHYSYNTINNILSVLRENVTTPQFEDFAAVLDAGFRTKTTVMIFAKNTQLNKKDPNFFRTLAELRARLEKEKALILSDKNADIVDIAEAVIELYKSYKR